MKDNNVYFVPDVTHLNHMVMLTKDGKPGEIYHGVPDWLYEGKKLDLSPMLYSAYAGFLSVVKLSC